MGLKRVSKERQTKMRRTLQSEYLKRSVKEVVLNVTHVSGSPQAIDSKTNATGKMIMNWQIELIANE